MPNLQQFPYIALENWDSSCVVRYKSRTEYDVQLDGFPVFPFSISDIYDKKDIIEITDILSMRIRNVYCLRGIGDLRHQGSTVKRLWKEIVKLKDGESIYLGSLQYLCRNVSDRKSLDELQTRGMGCKRNITIRVIYFYQLPKDCSGGQTSYYRK